MDQISIIKKSFSDCLHRNCLQIVKRIEMTVSSMQFQYYFVSRRTIYFEYQLQLYFNVTDSLLS